MSHSSLHEDSSQPRSQRSYLKRGVCTAAMLCVCQFLGSGCSTTSEELTAVSQNAVKTDYTKTSDVVYAPPEWPVALKADLYRPTGAGPWPAVVLIYGGNWDSKDHRWWMTLLARKLAKRGFVVLNVAYRGTPKFKYPAPVDDLRQALRWLRARAPELRLSPDRIAAYGFSAGGHLASLLGTLPAPPEERVQAVVAFSAPSDLTLFTGGEILPRFLGATFSEKPELFRDASPLTYVTADDPPFFLYHGTADTTVDPEHSRRFQAALERAGVPNDLLWVEGKGHAAMLFRAGAAEDAAVAFLDRTLRP